MKKRDWLLLALGDRMEPIQLQKTLFKFAQEAQAPKSQAYSFEPYNWGPCSFEIYEHLSALRQEGLLQFEPTGRGWNAYRLTDKGKAEVGRLESQGRPRLLAKLREAREYVVTRSFPQLLKDVYNDYPEYATKSLFPHPTEV